jgi:hypothetical protein
MPEKSSMHTLRTLVLLLLAIALLGCAPKAAPPATAPDHAAEARKHRSGYIRAVLEGRWCDARPLFLESQQAFVRTDDFCGAATNYLDLWRLTAHVGERQEGLLDMASETAGLSGSCPEVQAVLADPSFPQTPRETRYLMLIRSGDLDRLQEEIGREPDPLFRSVYFRKGAQEAIRRCLPEQAARLLEQARLVDAGQGWTALLIEDWRVALLLQPDGSERQRIIRRMELLQGALQPCPLPLANPGPQR